jgi:ABC-type Fe3+ transport system permease subunit
LNHTVTIGVAPDSRRPAMQGASQTPRYEQSRATRIAGIATLASFVVSLIGFFAAGVLGDDTEPYDESSIAVIAWETFLIAGAAFILLFVVYVVFVVLADLKNRRSDVSSEPAAKEL